MPNIAVIDKCNLKCPYCFADDMISEDKDMNEISLENFEKAVKFSLADGDNERIGIIGGEPTLHSKIGEILKLADRYTAKTRSNITIFTNGIHLDRIIPFITKDKFSVLVNINHPDIIGKKNYDKIIENLDMCLNVFDWKEKISVGINIYYEEDDYSFITDLIKRYHFDHVRTSFVAPTYKDYKKDKDAYYKNATKKILKVYKEIYNAGAHPGLDCNRIPPCYFTPQELEKLNLYTDGEYSHPFFCSPVIDIDPQLKAVRCFGVHFPVDISLFSGPEQLTRYFQNNIDCKLYKNNLEITEKCRTCIEGKTTSCGGGCLSFSTDCIDENLLLKNN